jgi:hypothetical protein
LFDQLARCSLGIEPDNECESEGLHWDGLQAAEMGNLSPVLKYQPTSASWKPKSKLKSDNQYVIGIGCAGRRIPHTQSQIIDKCHESRCSFHR